MTHPFQPFIIKNSKSMVIGTLPPEPTQFPKNINFYYSNSPNTRMWDLLKSIQEKTDIINRGSYKLLAKEKENILLNLNLSMADIIYEYEREKESTQDKDIIPIKYFDIKQLIKNSSIINLLFVYKSAAKWFLHSLEDVTPAKLSTIRKTIDNDYGVFYSFMFDNRLINCVLLPNPLNRGKKGYTLEIKKEIYKKWISEQS